MFVDSVSRMMALDLSRSCRVAGSVVLALALAGCPGDGGGESGETGATGGPGGTSGGTGSGESTADASSDVGTSTPTPTTDGPEPGTSTTVPEPTTAGPTGDPTGETGETGETGDTTTDTGEPPAGWMPRDTARVFLSGHSLTDNPLPDFVLEIADSLGTDFNFNEQIGLGSPIRVRTLGDSWDNLDWPGYKTGKNREGSNMDVIAELKDPQTLGAGERYDTLVITERHDILDTIRWEDTAGLLRHYHDRLIDGNPDAHTLLYHSWLDIDKAAPQQWIDHEKNALYAWECVASKINLVLADEGRSDRITTLPVGAALVDLVEHVLADEVAGISGTTPEKMNAIFNDNVHLTPLGVYYAALVTYAAVFRSSPVGAVVPPGVDPGAAADLQSIAWDFVRDYYTAPNPGVHTMEECRSFVSETVCPSFWTLLGDPGKIANCTSHFADAGANNGGNPFKWPDPGMMVWPAP